MTIKDYITIYESRKTDKYLVIKITEQTLRYGLIYSLIERLKVAALRPTCADDETIAKIAAQKDGFILDKDGYITGYKEPNTFCANYNRDVEETNEEERKEWERLKKIGIDKINATLEGKFSYLFKEEKDPIVEMVRKDLLDRSQVGIKKYGTKLDRTDLYLRDWLQHAYEENLDMCNYLKRAIVELDKKQNG